MTSSSFSGAQNRLEAAKEVIRDFLEARENDRVGLVVFQRDAIPLAPPSLDYKALDRMVSELNSRLLPDGTGIGVGLATAVNVLRESNAASRVVILLTDGQHNADSIRPLDAAKLAEALRIRVYTIGMVSEGRGGNLEVDEELLTEIAERTGARYYSAANKSDLANIYDEIGNLEKSRVGREHYERFTELEAILAGLAAALLAGEVLLRSTWLRSMPG
jgi:Ca-activated chloride channel family protein